MPIYVFKNTETEEVFEDTMKISERETFLQENPHIQAVPTSCAFGDPMRLGIMKPDDGFKDVLRKAKNAHPLGTIDV